MKFCALVLNMPSHRGNHEKPSIADPLPKDMYPNLLNDILHQIPAKYEVFEIRVLVLETELHMRTQRLTD